MSGILNQTGAVSGILGTTVGTVGAADLSGVLPSGVTGGSGLDATPLNGRNMIINGAMQVWQRATAATTVVNGSYHTADRYKFWHSSDGAWTSEKHDMSLAEINTTGHANALQMDVTTADGSIAAAQHAYFAHRIEAQNCQHLQWGTAAAKDVTVSFWVKSKIAGLYSFGIVKQDTTLYYINREYTINDADTWEYKTITITPTAGSTSLITGAGGIIANDNGHGLNLTWSLAFGSNWQATTNTWATAADFATDGGQVNWLSSTSNDFYITGIQFEAGSVATPFEHRSYGDELARCQRYAVRFGGLTNYDFLGHGGYNTETKCTVHLPVVMRAEPIVESVGTVGDWGSSNYATSPAVSTAIAKAGSVHSLHNITLGCVWSGGTTGLFYAVYTNNNTTGKIVITAEL